MGVLSPDEKGALKMKAYEIYDTKRKLVIFDDGAREFWIDSITVKVEKEGRLSNVVRMRAQNVHTNETTEWREYVGVLDPLHQFLKTLV